MTPEQQAELGYRVLAVVPRAPRGAALDRAAAEVAILISTECTTPAEIESLTAHLVAHPWRQWSFAAIRQAALDFLGKSPAAFSPAATAPAADDWGLPPDEFAALSARAERAGHDFYVEHESIYAEAERLIDALPKDKHAALMELARADFIAYMTDPANNMGHLHGRSMEQPALDRNARDIAIGRAFQHLVFKRPLMEAWPATRKSPTKPGTTRS